MLYVPLTYGHIEKGLFSQTWKTRETRGRSYDLCFTRRETKPLRCILRRVVLRNICAAARQIQQCAYAKTKAQISFVVIAKPISAFVFATGIVKFLYFLNTKFHSVAIFCSCTARFMSDLVKNHIVGFLMSRLI